MSRARAAMLLAALVLSACGRTKQDSHAGSAGSGSNGSSGSGTAGSTTGGTSQEGPHSCDEPATTAATLARLTGPELSRSWQSALGGLPAEVLLTDGPDTRFVSHVTPTSNDVAEIHVQAHDAALRFSREPKLLSALSECDAEDLAPACSTRFIENFLRRAFRRPATPADVADMAEVFATGVELGGGFASGARAVAQVALQSPEMLYLVEEGEATADGKRSLTSYELAARLSYFLTGAPPDEALQARSEQPQWDAAAVAKEARRLLGSPDNRARVRSQYAERYSFGWVEDSNLYLDPQFRAAWPGMRARAESFIDQVTFEGSGTFRSLLLEQDPTSAEPRPGLFTQPALLVSYVWPRRDPLGRGFRVLNELLCQKLPAPPPDVPSTHPIGPDSTWRQWLEEMTAFSSCSACHAIFNPVAFAFEHYDGSGEWRDQENGQPIDASGELIVSDARGSFGGVGELMELIAESEDAQRCFVDQWMEQAYRRLLTPADECARERLQGAFAATDGSVPELLVAIVSDPSFQAPPAKP